MIPALAAEAGAGDVFATPRRQPVRPRPRPRGAARRSPPRPAPAPRARPPRRRAGGGPARTTAGPSPSSRRSRGAGPPCRAGRLLRRPGRDPVAPRRDARRRGPARGRRRPRPTPALLPRPGEAAARERLAPVGRVGGAARLRGRPQPPRRARGRRACPPTSSSGRSPRWRCCWRPRGRATAVASSSSELAWREFYAHVLWHFPHVVRGAFRPAYDAVPWADDPAGFAAWREGRTGYPVVDAAMRQLAATGWMHNRARMIAATFLVKDLLIDWRRGEGHFMQHLVDGDLAANNGGWQWTAGTGTDAAPYFRVFNPVSQGRSSIPTAPTSGAGCRSWPACPDAYIHEPWTMPADVQVAAGCVIGRDYPAPIVDHAAARDRPWRPMPQPGRREARPRPGTALRGVATPRMRSSCASWRPVVAAGARPRRLRRRRAAAAERIATGWRRRAGRRRGACPSSPGAAEAPSPRHRRGRSWRNVGPFDPRVSRGRARGSCRGRGSPSARRADGPRPTSGGRRGAAAASARRPRGRPSPRGRRRGRASAAACRR